MKLNQADYSYLTSLLTTLFQTHSPGSYKAIWVPNLNSISIWASINAYLAMCFLCAVWLVFSWVVNGAVSLSAVDCHLLVIRAWCVCCSLSLALFFVAHLTGAATKAWLQQVGTCSQTFCQWACVRARACVCVQWSWWYKCLQLIMRNIMCAWLNAFLSNTK